MNSRSQHESPRRTGLPGSLLSPFVALALLLLLTALVTLLTRRMVAERDQQRFNTAVQATQNGIQDRMNTYVGALLGTSGLFAVVPVVDVHQFRGFVNRLDLKTRFPGIQGIGYSRKVSLEKRDKFNNLLRRLNPAFQMHPGGERPEYHAIMFLEPQDDRNLRAIGYDMFSEWVRRTAMVEARDSGLPVASGRVTLVQETDRDRQPGFLIYVPVYDETLPHRNLSERRRALMGFVYSPFRTYDLMEGILGQAAQRSVEFEVYDGTETRPENLLYRSARPGLSLPRSSLTVTHPFRFANHAWTLVFSPNPHFFQESQRGYVWNALWGGLALSFLVFLITFFEARARREGERKTEELRRSEEALRRSQEEIRLITDALPVLVSYLDASGRYRFMNRAYEEWFGQGPDLLLGRSMMEVLGEEAYQVLQPHIETVLGGQAVSFEAQVPYRVAGNRFVNASYTPQFGPDGQVNGFVALISDISERKRLEEGIRESEERFRLMADTAPVMIWIAGTDTLPTYFNKPWLDFRGRTLEQEIGGGWTEGIHPDDARKTLETYILAFNSRKDYQSEYRLRRADGEYRWVLERGTPRFLPDGGFAGYIGSGLDITERKRVEEKERFLSEASTLLASSLNYQTTLNRVAHLAVPILADWCAVDMLEPDGSLRRLAVVHTDPSKEEYAWELWRRYPPNPEDPHGMMRVLKSGESELYPEISDDLLVASTRDAEHLRIARELGLRSGMVVPLVTRGRTLGAITAASAESGRRYTREDLAMLEELAHRAAIAVDNSRLFLEVQEADRRKDEFLATLAHELRNPLAPMLNAVHLIRVKGSNDPVVQHTKEILGRQVMHMARLVDDLLDVSRITQGRIELRKESVDLQTVMEQAVQTSRPLIEEQRHDLHIALPPEPIPLYADPTRLVQVIANLLNNAAKYTDPGGRIDLSAERECNEVVLRVRDTGRGIKKGMLPLIFDLFTQVDPTLDRTQGGLGLGLTLVRQLTERHGGTVSAHSDGPGKGSEFVVRLPLQGDESAPPPPSEKADPLANSELSDAPPADATEAKRVLVVDDNQDAAQMLAELLDLWGHQVRTAHDGPGALELARDFHPEVTLLDIGLPKMDGYEVARQMRGDASLNGMFLVALTGYGQEADRIRSREAGFDRHITKPVDLETLRQLLSTTEH